MAPAWGSKYIVSSKEVAFAMLVCRMSCPFLLEAFLNLPQGPQELPTCYGPIDAPQGPQ